MNRKKTAALLLPVAIFCLSLGFMPQTGEASAARTKHEPVTEQLITMVEHSAEIKRLLTASIERAKRINPDRQTNPAQTLEEYYAFIDRAAKAMPWSILPDLPHSKLYDQIDQSLNYFYFINDQPLPELKNRGYYNNSLQYHEPYRTWLIHFVKAWGLYLSTEGSWKEEYYRKALADERFGLQRGWYEEPSRWKTFNQFFARYLKSPDQRPIASPGDPSVVSSPADSKPQGVWRIDGNSNIVHKGGVAVKSRVLKSVAELVGPGSAYRHAFAGGTFTHTFLDVNDYHRYHFPVDGTIREVRAIPGDDAVGGIITWDPKTKKYMFDPNTPGWQMIETRGCVIVETARHGLVALLPIGMSQVSSVNFEEDVKPGRTVRKGEMLGYFLFGGSDFVLLFQKGVDFELTVPREGDGTFRQVLMGEAFGRLKAKDESGR